MIQIINETFNIDQPYFLKKLKNIIKELKITGDIVVKFGDKIESQRFNSQFNQKEYPTDVLSFPFRPVAHRGK